MVSVGADRLVGLKYLMEITGWGRTTTWRKQKAGLLPASFQVGSSKQVWRKNDLDRWLSELGEVEVIHG